MKLYESLADEYYIKMNLGTEMKLPTQREPVLEFFERIQKSYPSMHLFYSRENGEYVLEEDKENGRQRWLSLESRRISSGYLNPPSTSDAMAQHTSVLQLLPYMMFVRPLDCQRLDYLTGFHFTYRGNHDELVMEALGAGPACEQLLDVPNAKLLSYQPSMTISLDETCSLQARLTIETRTNAYQVRSGEYGDDMISVYFAVRQFDGFQSDVPFEVHFERLQQKSEELLEEHVVEQVLQPLAQTIATK